MKQITLHKLLLKTLGTYLLFNTANQKTTLSVEFEDPFQIPLMHEQT